MALLVAGLMVAGCSGDPAVGARAAQDLADRLLPGQVRIVSVAASSAPGSPGSYGYLATIGLHGDPDGAALFVFTTKDDACSPVATCERELRDAVAQAAAVGAEVRAATRAFAECGHPVVAMTRPSSWFDRHVELSLTVTGDVGGPAVEPLATELDRCLAGWTAARAASGSRWAPLPAWLNLVVVDPAAAGRLPGGDPTVPTVVRLAAEDRTAAAEALVGMAAFVRTGPDAPAHTSALLRPRPTVADQQTFDAAVTVVAGQVLGSPVRPARSSRTDRFADGRTDRVRAYVPFCSQPGRACIADRAVAMTVDRAGGAATGVTTVPMARYQENPNDRFGAVPVLPIEPVP